MIPEHAADGGLDVADVDFDGQNEVVLINTSNYLRVYKLENGNYVKKFETVLPYGGNLDVGDADGDGKNEIAIAGGTDLVGYIKVFK